MKVLDNFAPFHEVESYYQGKIAGLQIDDSISAAGTRDLQIKMDAVYQQVSFDLAEAESAYKTLNRWKALMKKSGMFVCQDNDDSYKQSLLIAPGLEKSFEVRPKTQGDREAWANMFSASLKVSVRGETMNLEEALDLVERLFIYLQSVIDILKEKKNRIISILTSYKLEAELLQSGEASKDDTKASPIREMKPHWILDNEEEDGSSEESGKPVMDEFDEI